MFAVPLYSDHSLGVRYVTAAVAWNRKKIDGSILEAKQTTSFNDTECQFVNRYVFWI